MKGSARLHPTQTSDQKSKEDLDTDDFSASMNDGFDGRRRVMVAKVEPAVDGGRFAIKRIIGDEVKVGAVVFADGHEILSAVVKYRHEGETAWTERPLTPKPNDAWEGEFFVSRLGKYFYTVEAWVNEFETWSRNLGKKFEAGMDLDSELLEGADLISRSSQGDELLEMVVGRMRSRSGSLEERVAMARSAGVEERMSKRAARAHSSLFGRELAVIVDPPLARFGAWYELFPRSCAAPGGGHGTFKDCQRWLPRISEMGFDVVYLPPIHPIGNAFRKGKNGNLKAEPQDPGSPWAIGNVEGGHKAIDRRLGTLEDFRELARAGRALNLEVALDIAFQCSPNHPYVKEHPEWFRHRLDGSIQYAENPPKKYQDIYPFDFETEQWRQLWVELRSIFEFWIEQGVRVFRVDNPHTKPFPFWEWCLGSLKEKRADLIFLAEAFTRPSVMDHLAKVGFTQSYNYFPWRNSKRELEEFFAGLTQAPAREFFRANLWPNTPDILTAHLQYGGRGAFMSRVILAATLGASYGIYGPAFEFCENRAREPDSEEYLDSEKYEVRHWDLSNGSPLQELLTRLNAIRRQNPALQRDDTLQFHATDNDQLIAYTKHAGEGEEIVLTVVNLDPHHTHKGWVQISNANWKGFGPHETYQCHDLLTEARYLWSGARNYVELNPEIVPAHIFRLRRHVRTEHNFDYFI